MTKTTYKVGDKVRVLNAARILYASKYLNDGDITTVKSVSLDGLRPTLNVRDHTGSGGIYIMGRELPFIEKVVEASAHGYKVGDKMRILNAGRISGGARLTNGQVYEVVVISHYGNPRITTNGSLQLAIVESELPFVEKVVQVASKASYSIGDRVRILDTSKIMFGSQYFSNGDVAKVIGLESDGRPRLKVKRSDTYGLVILDKELPFVEKVESAVPVQPIEVSTMPTRISQLESQVEKLAAKVHALESGNVDIVLEPDTFKPNEHRAAVIEQAKQFVEDVTRRMDSGTRNAEGNDTYQHRCTKPYFTTRGRTVSVVVRGSGIPTEYERASATCAEGDVFNEDIGRAIALGRAMGLRIPTAFTKAPQPTQVVVGMEVTTLYHDGNVNKWCPTTVTNVRSGGIPGFGNGSRSSLFKIAEDTNAQYGTEAF